MQLAMLMKNVKDFFCPALTLQTSFKNVKKTKKQNIFLGKYLIINGYPFF